MGWIDNYRQAQFRTAEFFVPNAENDGGRRVAVHSFPKRDEPYSEDMGRKSKTFQIEAYVLGEDYFSKRDNLASALDQEGSGKLVHPYRGTINVICTNYSVRETVSETRIARFTITFVEAGSLKFPNAVIDTTEDVARKKEVALSSAQSSLEENFDISTVPFSVSQNAMATLEKALSTIEDAKQTVSAQSQYRRYIDNIKNKLIQLSYDVVDLAQEFADLLTFGTNADDEYEATSDNARNQFREMVKMFNFSPDETIGDDDPSLQFTIFIQQMAVINAMGLMSIIEWDSLNEATEFRDITFKKLEELILKVNSDELYTALYDLQTSIARDIDTRIRSLARLADYTLNTSLPAIVVSHDLYGNINEEQDILDRNRIVHPLFVPGGVPIEVRIYG